MARANKVAVASGADLPDRIVQLMTNARYASFVVRGDSDRTVFLPEIISLHTRRELSEISGIGRASIARIQTWLARQGRRLRRPVKASIPSFAILAFDERSCIRTSARSCRRSRRSPTPRWRPRCRIRTARPTRRCRSYSSGRSVTSRMDPTPCRRSPVIAPSSANAQSDRPVTS